MDCREFRERLDRYLAGALDAGEFERMVGHEAGCAACHGLASEALPEAPPAPTAAPGPDFTDEVLRRTVGADCGRIALALAAEVDGPLPAREAEQVVRHVRECPDCRALAHALELLPEAYRALPRLRAGGGFTRAVLARTRPAPPGVLSVLRRMWQGPALLWEGALVCSLLLTPVLGGPAREGASLLGGGLDPDRFGRAAAVISSWRWPAVRTDLAAAGHRTEERILDLGAWARRQVSIVWTGGRGAPDTDRTDPASGIDRPEEGGNDELRQP